MMNFWEKMMVRRVIRYGVIGGLLVLFTGCPTATGPSGGTPDAVLENRLTLKVGEEKYVPEGNFYVRFDGVLEDSRCPVGYECLWAGNGEVALSFRIKNDWEAFTLNTLLEPNQIRYGGFTVLVKALDPYPVADQEIDPDLYVLTLELK